MNSKRSYREAASKVKSRRESGGTKLSVASLLSVIDSLVDLNQMAVLTTKKITFGARNKAKLSAAQLTSLTEMGWIIGYLFDSD